MRACIEFDDAESFNINLEHFALVLAHDRNGSLAQRDADVVVVTGVSAILKNKTDIHREWGCF